MLVCGVCHTPSNGRRHSPTWICTWQAAAPYDFTDIDGTIITVNAENLTSHDPEGLHAWTDGQIRTAITKGVDDEHYAIYPIMPYPEYSLLKPEDVDSIISICARCRRTTTSSRRTIRAPTSTRRASWSTATKIPHTTLDESDPDYAAAERGRYLATVACLNCHTEEVVLPDGMIDHDVPDLAKAFAGGKQYAFDSGSPITRRSTSRPTRRASRLERRRHRRRDQNQQGQGSEKRTFCNTHPGGPERYGMMKDCRPDGHRDVHPHASAGQERSLHVRNDPVSMGMLSNPARATCIASLCLLGRVRMRRGRRRRFRREEQRRHRWHERRRHGRRRHRQRRQLRAGRHVDADLRHDVPDGDGFALPACHSQPPFDGANGNLSMGMDKNSAYMAVYNKQSTSTKCGGMTYVVPGKPEMSLLYLKLTATPPCGVQMPNGPTKFTQEQLDMVKGWIAAGAKND